MVIFIIYLLVLIVGISAIFYLLATSKETAWTEHVAHPEESPVSHAPVCEGRYPEAPWSIFSIKKEFNRARDQISDLPQIKQKPGKSEAFKEFFAYIHYSLTLMWKEKEIFTFAILQWAVIGAGYYLWVQMLGWIPAEVWRTAADARGPSTADLILWIWSFICVGLVAYPLGILTACMGAVHFIHRQNRRSSIAECFSIVLSKSWSLWVFTWMDSWITVNQILERLPKKNDRTTPAQKALKEALYYAWKIATIGIVPALVTGRGLIESCRHSIDVIQEKFKDVAKLRIAYSALCWVVGISAYIGTIFFFCVFRYLWPAAREEMYGHLYTFYFWAGIPILIAVSIVQVFLRPVYVIASCHIYSDYLNEKQETIMLPRAPSKGLSALVVFLILLFLLGVVILYRDQLGITRLLSSALA